jgi:hypothetical protein
LPATEQIPSPYPYMPISICQKYLQIIINQYCNSKIIAIGQMTRDLRNERLSGMSEENCTVAENAGKTKQAEDECLEANYV